MVELKPWSRDGAELRDRLEKLAAHLGSDDRRELAIAAMDRYARLNLGADARMVLPVHLARHLTADETDVVRIVVHTDRLWLWSEMHWRRGRQKRNDRLDALLGAPPPGPDEE